jgi:hypothetical protein
MTKSSAKRGTKFPTPLPPLVQHKIEQAKKEYLHFKKNKSKHVAQITSENKDDVSLPINYLYDDRVLYMMQKMGYDIISGPSLCDGRGQLAPFEKALSRAQLEALHEDQILIEKRCGLGYEVCMTSAKLIDLTEASPQIEDGNQPTIDDLEEINIGMILVQFLLVNIC